jgi:hypothetical protein
MFELGGPNRRCSTKRHLGSCFDRESSALDNLLVIEQSLALTSTFSAACAETWHERRQMKGMAIAKRCFQAQRA